MAVKAKEEVTMHRGNGGQAMREAEAVVDRAMARKGLVYAATAEELGATQTQGPEVDVPEDLMEGFEIWLDDYQASVVSQAERYVHRLAEEQRRARRGDIEEKIGEITIQPTLGCPAGYNAFDVLSFSPIELLSTPLMPASSPDKILRGTNLGTPNVTIAAYLAIVWTNPLASVPCGFAVPPTIQLGGHTLRIGFDVMNVTTVAAGPSFAFNIPLPAVVPPLLFIPVFFVAPTVATPQLFELNVTADIVESPRPYSAFATHHADIDNEISIFGNVPPELQHDELNRYLVYPF